MRVAVGISAFRSDDAVLKLVELIGAEEWPVEQIVVVDSLGVGELETALARLRLHVPISYHNSRNNLGSAGNLQKRLELGCTAGMDFVLALNHDAVVSRAVLESMLQWAHLKKLGALYPLRYRSGKRIFDLTGREKFPFRTYGEVAPPDQALVKVTWSSSNGALYSMEPLRHAGLAPDGSLWMGWEDYLYGLELERLGYRQYVVTAARTVDEYEYRDLSILGARWALMDKPSWYLYYSVRNLLQINFFKAPCPVRASQTLIWICMMFIHVLATRKRPHDVSAFRAYFQGAIDGLFNKSGKWKFP
jgi:GT2 family glycosyltransferase